MANLDKPEWPPLLQPGFCPMAVEDLRSLCVGGFKLSSTRPGIMSNLESVVSRLQGANVKGNLWVDGSFLTDKIDPEDVDMVLELQSTFLDNLTPDQEAALIWYRGISWADTKCDTYAFAHYPEDHLLHWEGKNFHAEWHRQFGFSRGKDFKGIAVLQLGHP